MKKNCFLCRHTCEMIHDNPEKDILIICPICGEYEITKPCSQSIDIAASTKGRKWILSAITRYATEFDRPRIKIWNLGDQMEGLLNSVRIPKSPIEKMNKILLYMCNKSPEFGTTIEFKPNTDYPLIFGKSGREMQNLFIPSEEMGFLKSHADGFLYSLTINGWEKVEELLKGNTGEGNKCFVAMWFAEDLKDIYKNGFEPALKEVGYDPIRIDLKQHNRKICDEIIGEIRQSVLVIADFTGNREGVYFEAGFAQGLGIPVIWTCRKDCIEKLHLDTRQYNHITWEAAEDLKIKLIDRIKATVPLKKKL